MSYSTPMGRPAPYRRPEGNPRTIRRFPVTDKCDNATLTLLTESIKKHQDVRQIILAAARTIESGVEGLTEAKIQVSHGLTDALHQLIEKTATAIMTESEEKTALSSLEVKTKLCQMKTDCATWTTAIITIQQELDLLSPDTATETPEQLKCMQNFTTLTHEHREALNVQKEALAELQTTLTVQRSR